MFYHFHWKSLASIRIHPISSSIFLHVIFLISVYSCSLLIIKKYNWFLYISLYHANQLNLIVGPPNFFFGGGSANKDGFNSSSVIRALFFFFWNFLIALLDGVEKAERTAPLPYSWSQGNIIHSVTTKTVCIDGLYWVEDISSCF